MTNKHDMSRYIQSFTPESVYVLGFLWADGYFDGNRVGVRNLSSDIEEIKDLFPTSIGWKHSGSSIPKSSKRPMTQVRISSKELTIFLKELGYSKRSLGDCKLLELIPFDLHRYWYRGLIDGDGNWFIGKYKNKYVRSFTISGPKEQSWKFVSNLLEYLGCYFTTQINKLSCRGKESFHSKLYVSRFNDILTLGEYIYEGFPEDGIGLKRKYDKFRQIVDSKTCTKDQLVV